MLLSRRDFGLLLIPMFNFRLLEKFLTTEEMINWPLFFFSEEIRFLIECENLGSVACMYFAT